MTKKKKVLELKSSTCVICAGRYQWPGAGITIVEIRSLPSSAYMSLEFHENCWNIASNTSQKKFTYEEWIDLTGDEWDVFGPVRKVTNFGLIHYDRGFSVAEPWFNKKYGSQP